MGRSPRGTITASITITPQNDPPEPGEIADIRLLEDAPDLEVPLFDAFEDPDDPDNALTYTIDAVSNPAIFDDLGTASINQQTGILTLDFLNNTNGRSTVTVRATDPVGGSGVVSFEVELAAVNDAPSMTIPNLIDLDEDPGTVTINDWATNITPGPPDESNQVVTASVTENTNSELFSTTPVFVITGSTATLSFTPSPEASGIADITITLMDNGGITNGGVNAQDYTFSIIIRGDNDPPSAADLQPINVLEDGQLAPVNLFEVFDDVEDADSLLTYTIQDEDEIDTSLFASAVIEGNPAILSIDLQPDAFGQGVIDIRATDTEGLWVEAAFIINVLSVNDVPTYTRSTDITVQQNSPLQTFPEWATDIQAGPANESGQEVEFIVISNDTPSLFQTPPSISSDGTLTFEPSPLTSAFGLATVVVALRDDGGIENGGIDQSIEDTLRINLVRFNTPPVANNDNYFVDQGQTLQRNAASGVLINDSDAEDDALIARLIQPPVNGTLTFNEDGSFSYRHDNSVTTNDQFQYIANDGIDDSEVATVTISIEALDALFLTDIRVPEDSDSMTVNVATQLTPTSQGTYAYELSSVSNPTLFTRVHIDSLSGVLSIVYAPNQFGSSNLNLTALPNDEGESINITQRVEILPVNDPPIAVADNAATLEGRSVEIDVLSNDVDFDNDNLRVVRSSDPAVGALRGTNSGVFTYEPPADFTGEVTFTYVAEDDSSALDEGTVVITVFAGQFSVAGLSVNPANQISEANSVSNVGEVVGVTRGTNGVVQAFSSLQELPSTSASIASGANDFGQVVGATAVSPASAPETFSFVASRWDTSGVTILGSFDDAFSQAFGINNEGRIVGTSTWNNYETFRAFFWDAAQLVPLEAEGESQAFAINEQGQIAGYQDATATIWNGELISRTLSGADGRAYDINERGQVIGSIADDGTIKAAFWDIDNNLTELHITGSPFSEALSINNASWVVGRYIPPAPAAAKQFENGSPEHSTLDEETVRPLRFSYEIAAVLQDQVYQTAGQKNETPRTKGIQNDSYRAFLWLGPGSQLININDFIDAASGWTLLEARGINNAAQISGIGLLNGERRAFILSPTINKAPVASDDVLVLQSEGETLFEVTHNDSDGDGDTFHIASVTQGQKGSVSIQDDHRIVYTPGALFDGIDSFTYTIMDAHGLTDKATVTVRWSDLAAGTPYSLSQNYPNPFNPTTTIQYGLTEDSHVRLVLFNAIGQRVVTLVDGPQNAGTHVVTFDATGLPGGVYMYRLQAGGFTDTKQLTLLK